MLKAREKKTPLGKKAVAMEGVKRKLNIIIYRTTCEFIASSRRPTKKDTECLGFSPPKR